MRSGERERISLLLKVARLYWLDGYSQEQVAAQIGYSRPQVSRILSEARQRGVVTVNVRHPLERAMQLESALTKQFKLPYVHVALPPDDHPISSVANLAVEVIDDLLTRDSIIAITNGRSIASVVRAYPQRHLGDSTVVQAIGSIARETHNVDAPELARRLASALGGGYRILPAPVFISDPMVARALRRESSVHVTMSMAAHADILLTGIGPVTDSGSGIIFDEMLPPKARAELRQRRAVATIGGHHIDAHGQHLDGDLCQQIVSIPFERMREIQYKVAIAWGEHKAEAIRAVLTGELVTHLVTDVATARAVLGRSSPA